MTPSEFPWTDLCMRGWFLAQPWCQAQSAMIQIGSNTWTHQLLAELAQSSQQRLTGDRLSHG